MKYLIGDIGNTSTKICLLNQKFKIIKHFEIDTKKNIKNNFLKRILGRYKTKNLNPNFLFSSVVLLAFKEMKKRFKYTKYKIYEVKDFDLKKIIKLNVKNTKQLGSDRIANAIGVQKFNNCLVVDFGTATTFDVIKNNIYEGGVIAPGVRLSITNLYNSTALLPLIKLKNIKKSFGKNTKDALNAGFMWGYEGLINNIINKIVKTNKTNFKIILTGGYANFFKNSIKKKVLIDQNITIKGIAKIYKKFL